MLEKRSGWLHLRFILLFHFHYPKTKHILSGYHVIYYSQNRFPSVFELLSFSRDAFYFRSISVELMKNIYRSLWLQVCGFLLNPIIKFHFISIFISLEYTLLYSLHIREAFQFSICLRNNDTNPECENEKNIHL